MTDKPIPFLSLEHISVRYLDKTLFDTLNWQINKGEHWAITGPGGAGKTALLNTIFGKFNIINGSIVYHFYENWRKQHAITDPWCIHRRLIAMVGHHHTFRNRSNVTTDFYYQQRFNSMDADNAITVREYLELATVPAILLPLQIESLLDKSIIKLSNGETRRIMIAHALLAQPHLLLLDNPYIGLDKQARQDLSNIINDIIATGTTVLLATTHHEIPNHITHVLTLENGTITGKYTRKAFIASPLSLPTKNTILEIDAAKIAALVQTNCNDSSNSVVRMEDIHVYYNGKTILDGINWTVKPNEKWALLGPNGSGKSTLLSLINGDNPQAYANKLWLFDRKRGSGESIWDIKKKIGFVSPELHQYFTTSKNCLQIVCSGFSNTIGNHPTATSEQQQRAKDWMSVLDIAMHELTPFNQVSESIQRLTLLARALVKNPSLLILDEPCQGLDAQQKLHFKSVMEQVCAYMPVTLIFVTHYEEELPSCIDKFIRLNKGQIAAL